MAAGGQRGQRGGHGKPEIHRTLYAVKHRFAHEVLEQGGDDTLEGGAGDDILRGMEGDDLLNGGSGEDELVGGAGQDSLNGGDDDDGLEGGADQDILRGGAGDDILVGYLRPDGVSLLQEGERLFPSTDMIDPDTLEGGEGEDLMILGRGDVAYGGAGEDIFTVGTWMAGDVAGGTIADFEPTGEEIVILVPSGYTGAAVVEVVPDGADALVRMDGQTYVRVAGAAVTLTAGMINVAFAPAVTA